MHGRAMFLRAIIDWFDAFSTGRLSMIPRMFLAFAVGLYEIAAATRLLPLIFSTDWLLFRA